MAMTNHKPTTRDIIRSFEAKALKKRPFAVRIADYLTSFFGGIAFFTINSLVFVGWILINTGSVPGVPVFDPFPFILLTMAVSLEAIFLTIIVLMSQNRQSFITSLREELQLQVNLITERELTKALKLLSDIHKSHGIKTKEDAELEAMLKDIDTSYIERKLEEQLKPQQTSIPQVVAQPIVKVAEAVNKTLTPPGDKTP